MKGSISNQVKEENGFERVYAYCPSPDFKKELTDYGKEHRLLLEKIYCDDGDREQLHQLCYLESMKNKPKKVLLRTIDDLGEGYEKDFMSYLLGWRGFEVFCIDGSNVSPIIGYMTSRDREIRVEKMTRGRERKAKSGNVVNGRSRYGYYWYDGKHYIDKYEAFVVKFIFYRRAQGCSYYMIANELNLRGFRNRNDRKFWASGMKKIIDRKRFYQGYYTYNGVEYKGSHTPILSEDESNLFDKRFENKMMNEEDEAKLARLKEKYGRSVGKPPEVKPFFVIDDSERGDAKRRKMMK